MKNKKKPTVAVAISGPESVRIEKADNGFTVSSWSDKGCKQMVAKSETEAMRHAKKLLSGAKK